MNQTIGAMQPGATYIFSAYIRTLQHTSKTGNPSDGTRVFVTINRNAIDGGIEYLSQSTSGWYQIKYKFTAPTDANTAAKSSLVIGISGQSTTLSVLLGIDDVSITPA